MTDLRKAVEMAVPLLIGYREYSGDHRISNRCGEVLEALRQALAQPEFDTPESHIVKWSIPVDPNNFGEALAQPEQDWSLLQATQASLREHQAKIKELEAQLTQPVQEELIQFKDGKWSYVRKPWVGLTDDDCIEAQKNSWNEYKNGKELKFDGFKLCKNIEQLLKEKNNAF